MTTRFVTLNSFAEEKISIFADYFSLTKPRLSSLVIFTCALGVVLAPGDVSLLKAFLSVMATSGLVAGGCAINCWMERDIDAKMERTKNRPLPAGRISTTNAFLFGLALSVISLLVLNFFVNPITALLGLIAAVFYLALYTPMKRKTSAALYAGAIPGAIPPLMGWTTVTESIGDLGLVLFAILFIWQLPHFLSISIYHAKDYNNADIKVLPANIGFGKTVHWIVFYTLCLFLVSLLPWTIGYTSRGYKYAVYFIGWSYFLFSLRGYLIPVKSERFLQWARQYFYGSLIYLPCVFILMLYFR